MKALGSIKTVTVMAFVLFSISCRKENAFDCAKPNGKDISELRYPGNFTFVEVDDKVDVTVFNGTEYKVEVVAGKNIINNISTRVSDGVLKIGNDNKCNFVRGYKRIIQVNITVPYLKKISNKGVGTVRFAGDFAQDTLIVRAESSGDIYVNGTFKQLQTSSHGNGDVYVNGSCNVLYVYCMGTNYLYAGNIHVKDYVFIQNLSVGDCYINTVGVNTFEYNIGDAGNIYYKGQPSVVTNYSDKGARGKAIETN